MKRLLLINWLTIILIFGIGLFNSTYSQSSYPVTVTTFIEPPYSPYFADYVAPEATKWKTTVFFNDAIQGHWDVKLRLTMECSKVKIQTKPETSPIFTIYFGSNEIHGDLLSQYFQFPNLNVMGMSVSDLSRNGRLPEGFYSFCVEVLDAHKNTVLAQSSCMNFWIQLNDEPITITPICGQVVRPNPTQNIQFQWHQSNMISPNSLGTEYQLTLYEITDNTINPLNAIQNNKVLKIFESGFINQNSFLYDMTAPILDVGKKYIYTVQGRDIEGKDIFKNKGISQPCWFYYGYPNGGTIPLKAPGDLGGLGISDPPFFKWGAPSITIPNQSFYYYLKIVKFDSTQTAEDAIEHNPVWYEERSGNISDLSDYSVLLPKKLDAKANYAWQVTAFSDGQQIAISPVYSVYGPPLVDGFYAGLHFVKVKTTFNNDLNNLSGVGIVSLSQTGKSQEVKFSNLRLIHVAGRVVLDNGTLTADLVDTTAIELNPEYSDNGSAYFHPKKLKLDKDELDLYGKVTWAFPHLVNTPIKPYVVSVNKWMNFDSYKINGNIILNSSNSFLLINPYNFKLNLYTSSDFLISDNKYKERFDGEFVLPDLIKGTNLTEGNVKVKFIQVEQLYYLTNENINLTNNILPLDNSNMVVAPLAYSIDLSSDKSPLKLSDLPEWRGIYFQKFRVDFNIDADRFGQLVFTKPVPVTYALTANDMFVNWIGSDGLNLFITNTFKVSDKATFNKFPAQLSDLIIDIEQNSIKRGSLTGKIFIPFVSTTTPFTFTDPISNSGFEPGYLDSLDGTKFTFNKGSGEQEVNIDITRAVFADRERLDMTLDIEWPSLNASLSSLTGFSAYGDKYRIGFLIPNGTMTLRTQVDGSLSNYPVTFDAIGAGSSNGAYAFGLTGKAVLAEDVSGHDGPPAINIYSTLPNSFLPNEPYVATQNQIADNSIPSTDSHTTYEDNLNVIKNDMVNRMYQSNSHASSSSEGIDLSQSFTEEVTNKTSGDDIIKQVDQPKRDSSWSNVKFNIDQAALLNDAMQIIGLIIAQPLTDSISSKINKYVVKVTSKIDKVRDSINVKVDRKVRKVIDSLEASVAGKLKKENFDPTEQINQIGDSIANNLSKELRNNISRSIDNGITNPIKNFFNTSISGRINFVIESEVKSILINLKGGKIDFEDIADQLVDNLPIILHGISEDAYGMIQLEKINQRMWGISGDALRGVKVHDINSLLMRAIDAEASHIVSRALSNKASQAVDSLASRIFKGDGNATASAGLGIQMNFENLGRNLKEGRVDKVVKLDAVSVKLETKFVDFGGLIYYTANDPNFGDIWKGGINLNVKMPRKFSLGGVYINGRKGDMPYWFCQITGVDTTGKPGMSTDRRPRKLSSPVNLGPVELVAASGRLYHHMTDLAGRPITPDANTKYGAGVGFVFFDASGHGKAMRLALDANVEIKEDNNYIIDFEGDLEAVCKNPTPENPDNMAWGAGGVSLNYNSAESHFLGKGWVLFNKGLCAKGNFMVDVKPGYWNVEIGTRDNMIMITPGCLGWGAAGWVDVNQTTANIGLGISYSIQERIGFNFKAVSGGINVNAGLAAGVDATVQYKPSVKLLEAGIWADLWANIGIDYSTPFKSGYINLVNINCHGDLLMTFEPPPTTLQGSVRGHVEILFFGIDFDAGIRKTL